MRRSPPDSLRPIGARPLKSVRDTLRPRFPDARVLDLFAGQGRLGEAALEEGAAEATFVDRDRGVMEELRKRLARHGDRCRFYRRDALEWLQRDTDTYDILFADPPFPLWKGKWGATLYSLAAPRLAPGGIFLVKHPSRVIASGPPKGLVPWKDSVFGESRLIYLLKEEEK